MRSNHDLGVFSFSPFSRYMRMQLYCISGRNAMMFSRSIRAFVCALVALGATAVMARAEDLNDYPTAARADYVFGCMKANGETRQALDQCSRSIDVVATLLPYERYISAETVL